jgi:hypothetical protein
MAGLEFSGKFGTGNGVADAGHSLLGDTAPVARGREPTFSKPVEEGQPEVRGPSTYGAAVKSARTGGEPTFSKPVEEGQPEVRGPSTYGAAVKSARTGGEPTFSKPVEEGQPEVRGPSTYGAAATSARAGEPTFSKPEGSAGSAASKTPFVANKPESNIITDVLGGVLGFLSGGLGGLSGNISGGISGGGKGGGGFDFMKTLIGFIPGGSMINKFLGK